MLFHVLLNCRLSQMLVAFVGLSLNGESLNRLFGILFIPTISLNLFAWRFPSILYAFLPFIATFIQTSPQIFRLIWISFQSRSRISCARERFFFNISADLLAFIRFPQFANCKWTRLNFLWRVSSRINCIWEIISVIRDNRKVQKRDKNFYPEREKCEMLREFCVRLYRMEKRKKWVCERSW